MENSQGRALEMIMFPLGLVLVLTFSTAAAEELEPVNFLTDEVQSISQTYIIFTEKPEAAGANSLQYEDLNTWYQSFLPTSATPNQQKPQIVHTYRNVVRGFAARLTADQVKAMGDKEGFLSAQPERMLSLQTTHSPKFLGLMNQGLGFWMNGSNYGKGVIIGIVDTGIWPDHPSFGDEGVPPPPAKWKGRCEFKETVCNNKLIGARNCVHGGAATLFPYEVGHGTHTSSTAAGNFVKGANAYGNGNGTAVGMAPHAHLAIYKVCSVKGCKDGDVLAAIDAAVEDGVDVISISMVYNHANYNPFYEDTIAVGALGATQKGVLVSCSAGNIGYEHKTLSNEAPWILTVGASTIDRTIKATARLGNGAEFDGESVFQPKDFHPVLLPLVYPGSNGNRSSAFCEDGSLRNMDVKGKIVLCETGGRVSRTAKGYEVRSAGGATMIVINREQDGYTTLAEDHVLPATHLDYASGLKIKAYINSTQNPEATILFRGTVIGESSSVAPAVPFFSSRGPSKASPGILKPDIIGPGVSILAAYPFPSDNDIATRAKSMFNIMSGTSMSCPHLSGIAALLKSSHPDWSPAAIKSAIMTTADVVNHHGKPIVDEKLYPADVFAIGAGHVNPSKANDPGLVYDIQPDDYIPYLCGLKYTDKQVEVITKRSVKCCKVESIAETQLNYPSFSVILGTESLCFTRTVTNVGDAKSTYTLEKSVPPGMDTTVIPEKLVFSEINQKATYTVEFIPQSHKQFGEIYPQSHTGKNSKRYAEGYLRWVSDKYSVRSPISIIFA
ncbi:subtilisin-like protease 3 [Ziziphus jujuba]|uniref:Subtilisin-like protease 3 n=2 Tax=Ziziphus jujuba TaxID=326968 RepID=A0A6P4BJ38_ZIZJJ|nr:subtilisin-like protease 3 [Ziziphus jujuba]KAH7512675.1 hypothetical protein FEM48_Zijuj12G0116000 [Ziziphus jujuba var. spinosa]